MKKFVLPAVAGLSLMIIGCGLSAPDSDHPVYIEPTISPLASHTGKPNTASSVVPKTNKSTVAPKKVVTIDGDDLVLVGTDVPPGTYRTNAKVDGMCYWSKSKDAEGQDIIDNGIPAGGRPQVTLKKGQWFTTSDCPTWIKQ